MKNVKYLLMFITISACLFASAQRVNSLGGNVGYWPDDDNAWTYFPHTINNSNLAQVSGLGLGSTDHKAIVRWGEGTKWGFTWDQANKNDMVNLQYGNGAWGATFGLGMWADDDGIAAADGGDDAGAMSSTRIGASWGSVMPFGDLGVGFATYSKDDGNATALDEDDATMDFWVNMSRDQSLWIFDNMLVTFMYGTDNNTTRGASSANKFAQTTMDLDISYYTHINISDNTTALVAMGFGYESISDVDNTEKKTSTVMTLPTSTFAVESAMTDWATCRLGVVAGYNLSNVTNSGVTNAKDVTKRGGTDTAWTVGLGFNYGGFNLDINVAEDIFANPVQHIVGFEPLNGAADATATLSYVW